MQERGREKEEPPILDYKPIFLGETSYLKWGALLFLFLSPACDSIKM